MKNIIDIKNRMRSVKEMAQITRAMEMISVSKVKKAERKYNNNIAYFNAVRAAIRDILYHAGEGVEHPYLQKEVGDKTAYIVIASDKGLAGSYNHDVLKLAYQEISKQEQKNVLIVGQMAREFFALKGISPDVEYLHAAQNPTLDDARGITQDLIDLYDLDFIDSIKVVYTEMVSPAEQRPVVLRLLPILKEDFADIEEEEASKVIFDFEPSPKEVLDILAPQYALGIVFSCLIQSVYSENYERMRMMKEATENAKDLINKLSLEYNRARQEAITKEIAELSSSSLFQQRE
ncbi:MAG TPA: ATP synthase F1 subunit gamma [Clostridiales bacterium]|nr:ATP synthase F1 subunit gamma [Clostridiales bacterium]